MRKQSPIRTAVVNHSYKCGRQLSYSKNFDLSLKTPDGFCRPLFFYIISEGLKEKNSLGAQILLMHWDKFEAQHGDKQRALHHSISDIDYSRFFT